MRRSLTYLAILALITILLALPAFAESIKIAGRSFRVDTLSEIDAQSSKITLFGQTKIVAKAQLERYVLERYAQHHAGLASFSSAELVELFKNLLDQDKGELAALLIPELLSNRKLTQELSDLIAQKADGSNPRVVVEICKRSLDLIQTLADGQTLLSECLFDLTLLESDWLRSNHSAILFRSTSQVLDRAQSRLEVLLSRFELKAGVTEIEALEVVFGANHERVRAMRLAQSRAEELTRLARDGVSEKFIPLLEATFNDPLIAPLVTGLSLQLVHEQVQKLIALEEPARALRLISMVPLAKRSPITHQLTLTILPLLKDADRDLLAEPAVRRFISAVSALDNGVKEQSLKALSSRIFELLSQNNPELSDKLMQTVLTLRPDPNAENDSLRAEQANALLRLGRFTDFDSKLEEFRTSLPLTTRLRFWTQRLRTSPAIRLFMILLGLLLIILVLLRFHRARLLAEARRKQEQLGIQSEQEDQDQPRGVGFANFRVGLSPRRNEYNQCLAVLGLKSGATIKDIKAAYRTLVKEVHPDRQATENIESQDKFIELTSIYDRILELRDQLGIVDSVEK